MKLAHNIFLDSLMEDPVKRNEFLRGLKELREERVNRLKRSNTQNYELRNKCK